MTSAIPSSMALPHTGGAEPDLTVGWHTGARAALLALFELAEDSPSELDGYLGLGRVLLASKGGEAVGHLQLVDTDRAGVTELRSMAVREGMQGRGIGRRLVQFARALLAAEGVHTLTAATATADIGNLRFYQRVGFRMCRIERDVFTEAAGYPPHTYVDGIPLRDRVWLDLPLERRDPGVEPATTTNEEITP
jgi:GNAT superfamily N-acetyltransferase